MINFSIPIDSHLQKLLEDKTFFIFVAIDQGKVVGGLTAYTLEQYYSEKRLAYIFDLAVLTRFQRQGIGQSLIQEFNSFCKNLGYEEVFVQADRVDDHAIEFYKKTNGILNDVIHFDYPL